MLITRGSNMIFNHQPPLATQWLGRWPTGYPMFTTDIDDNPQPQKTSKRLAHVGDRQLPRVVFLALFSDRRGLVPEYRGQHRSTTGSWNRSNREKKKLERCLRSSLIHWSYMIIIQFPWLKIKKLLKDIETIKQWRTWQILLGWSSTAYLAACSFPQETRFQLFRVRNDAKKKLAAFKWHVMSPNFEPQKSMIVHGSCSHILSHSPWFHMAMGIQLVPPVCVFFHPPWVRCKAKSAASNSPRSLDQKWSRPKVMTLMGGFSLGFFVNHEPHMEMDGNGGNGGNAGVFFTGIWVSGGFLEGSIKNRRSLSSLISTFFRWHWKKALGPWAKRMSNGKLFWSIIYL